MSKRITLIGALALAATACETVDLAAPEPAPEILPPAIVLTDAERDFADAIRAELARVRYLEGGGEDCADATFPEWEGLPLIECAYDVENANGESRFGKAIMLNPSAEQLTRWVFSACVAIEKDNAVCRDRLYRHILGQSGAQFVVAGLVWEDVDPDDGAHEGYTFRNGVTVRLEGVPNGGVRQLDAGEIARALSPQTAVIAARRFARIASTSPDDYRANGGTADVGTTAAPSLAWPATIAALYRAAWNRNENELVIAWARAHPGALE